MLISLDDIFNILIPMIGVLFMAFTIIDSRTLVGSFFKTYYRIMIGASIALLLGFIIEPIAEWVGLTGDALAMATHAHHVSLVVASILFIYAGRSLPKDARKYMESKPGA